MSTNFSPDQIEPDEPEGTENLKASLHQADQSDRPTLDVPPPLDAAIVSNGQKRILQNLQAPRKMPDLPSSGANMAESGALTRTRGSIGSPMRRFLWWVAAASSVLVLGWWFRYWSATPIDESAGYGDFPVGQVESLDRESVSNELALAVQARKEGRITDAIEHYRRVLRVETNEPSALFDQARLLAQRWDLESAQLHYSQLLRSQTNNHEARIERATIFVHAGKYSEAETDLIQLETVLPGDPRIMRLRGFLEEVRGNLDASKSWRERALLAEPTNEVARADLRSIYATLGLDQSLPEALGRLAGDASEVPIRDALHLAQAAELDRLNRPEEALALLEPVIATGADVPESKFLLARILIHREEYQRAEELLRSLLSRPNSLPEWRFELAHALHHQSRDEEAWREFEAAYLAQPEGGAAERFSQITHTSVQGPLDPAVDRLDRLFRQAALQHPEQVNEIGYRHAEWFRSLGAYDRARQTVESYMKTSDGPGLRLHLALAYADRNDLGRAADELEKATRLSPGYDRAWYEKGAVFERQGRLVEAVAAFKRALLISPAYRAPANGLRRVRERQQQARQTAEDYVELIRQRPSGRAWYLLRRGYAWADAGWPDRLLRDATEGLLLQPGNVELQIAQADGWRRNGKYDLAREAAEKLLVREPRNYFANWMLGEIAVELGDLEIAEKHRLALHEQNSVYESLMLKGRILVKVGRYDEAQSIFERAESYTGRRRATVEQRGYASRLALDPRGADDYAWLLEKQGIRDYWANYWIVDRYLLLRLGGRDQEAATQLKDALDRARDCYFPSVLFHVFSGEIPHEVAVAHSEEVAFETLRRVELWPHRAFGYEVYVRAQLGAFAEVEGDFDAARTHYRWLTEHPDRLSSEYLVMATNRLSALEGKISRGRLPSAINSPAAVSKGLGDQLLAWLPLSADLNDHGPQGLTVTNRGNVRMENGVARFPGNGHFLELPHVSLKNRNFSICFWMKLAGEQDHYSLFSQKQSDDCGRAMYFQLRGTNQLYWGFMRDNVAAPSAIPDRRDWNHVVIQYEHFHQSIWLNGRKLVERLSQPFEAEAGSCRIGAMPTEWNGHFDFDGWMRDFRIYGRALTQSEIHQLSGVDRLLSGSTVGSTTAQVYIPSDVWKERRLSSVEQGELLQPRPFLQISGNRLTISGPPVQVYELQVTPDLAKPWYPLVVLTNQLGAVDYVDADTVREGLRFYRVRLLNGL